MLYLYGMIRTAISINGKRIYRSFKTQEEVDIWRFGMIWKHSDPSLKGEIWLPIDSFSRYEASNLGRIRSLNYKKTGLVKVLQPARSTDGYLKTMLQRDDKKYITIAVHRKIAQTFHGHPEGKEVNHIDGVKTNNQSDNLEWITHSQNCKHSFDMNLQKPKTGELNGMSKLTPDQVRHARKLKNEGGRFWGRNELAEKWGIAPKHLQKIVNNPEKTWYNV
jgi:hypothetical protein